MICALCGAAAWLQVHTERRTLALCRACATRYERRMRTAPISRWLQQLRPPPRTHTRCPLCGTTPEQIQQTGLFGCCICYQVFGVLQV